ncbi:MAG: hypothetical protein Q9157_004276 [Trypethelium eluteriae]
MLNGETPYIQVITNSDDHIHRETPIDANSQSQGEEHERDLVNVVSQSTRPTKTSVKLEPWSQTIKDTSYEGPGDHILEGKLALEHVCNNHLADRIRVEQTDEHDKWDKMSLENDRLQTKAYQALPGHRAEYKDDSSVHHVPFIPGKLIQHIRDECMMFNAKRAEHGLLPKASAAKESGDGIDDTESQDSFDRA